MKIITWKFFSLNPKILELLTRKVFSLKNGLLFNLFCFCMFVNRHFTYLRCAYLKKKKGEKGVIMLNLRYTTFL